MYRITGKYTSEVKPSDGAPEGLLNGNFYNLDIEKIDSRTWHIVKDHKSYYVQWVERNEETKSFTLKVNGQLLELSAKNDFDLLLDQMGLSSMAGNKANKLKAPMPGKVLQIMVEPGQEVAKGEALLILEAMKMENVLKATDAVTIKSVNIAVGDAVEKNNILLEFE